ncbi:MAG: N-terminal phage integrase SAM-like domain-containing protein [Oscillospiraceae bacterium]
MTFGDFICSVCQGYGAPPQKPSTVASKKWLIDLKVTPFFKKIPLNEIKPTHVRQWQNSLTSYRDENGKPYAQTYLKCINNQLTAIFNYAVKYYGLKKSLPQGGEHGQEESR